MSRIERSRTRDLGPGTSLAVVILAGGGSRRFGAGDKTAALLDGRPVMARLLADLTSGALTAVPPGPPVAVGREGPQRIALGPVVVVGPEDHPCRQGADGVRWTRERPAGGGPVAAVAAGLAALAALAAPAPSATPAEPAEPAGQAGPGPAPEGGDGWVAVVAGDQPFAATALPRLLAAALDSSLRAPAVVAAFGVDPDGRRQPLLAVYRWPALAGAVATAEPGWSPAGRSIRSTLGLLPAVEVALTAAECLDVDTPEHLARAGRLLAESKSHPPLPEQG